MGRLCFREATPGPVCLHQTLGGTKGTRPQEVLRGRRMLSERRPRGRPDCSGSADPITDGIVATHPSRNIEPEFGLANVQTYDGQLSWYRKVMERGSRLPDPVALIAQELLPTCSHPSGRMLRWRRSFPRSAACWRTASRQARGASLSPSPGVRWHDLTRVEPARWSDGQCVDRKACETMARGLI